MNKKLVAIAIIISLLFTMQAPAYGHINKLNQDITSNNPLQTTKNVTDDEEAIKAAPLSDTEINQGKEIIQEAYRKILQDLLEKQEYIPQDFRQKYLDKLAAGEKPEDIMPEFLHELPNQSRVSNNGLLQRERSSISSTIIMQSALGEIYTYEHGTGISENPYQIWTSEDLNGVRTQPDKHYRQMTDIDLSGYSNWEPIETFTGSYDGNGYTITNMTIERPDQDNVGFFGYLSNATITNVALKGTVTGNSNVGGLAGVAYESTIMNCYSEGDVISTGVTFDSAGGFVGASEGSIIKYCYSIGNVICTISDSFYSVGGFIGTNWAGFISVCYSIGNVTGISGGSFISIGGFIGDNREGFISDCYSTGNVTCNSSDGFDSVGGFIGTNWAGFISDCYSIGNVTGTSSDVFNFLGGFIGLTEEGPISNCYTIGDVASIGEKSNYVGGFIGVSISNTIKNCYVIGNITGTDYVGGFTGSSECTIIKNCYIHTNVSINSNPTPDCFIYENIDSEIINSSWQPIEAMKKQDTYVGWDFQNIWSIDPDINSGYPYLLFPEESNNDILSFSLEQQQGPTWINSDAQTIYVGVEEETDLTSLVATFTLSDGATATVNGIPQESGVTANNFTEPVEYTVTASDGSSSVWVVAVAPSIEEVALRTILGIPPDWCVSGLEPVNLISGNYYSNDRELNIPTRSVPLEFVRSYNSRSVYDGTMGKGWTHNYNSFLTFEGDGTVSVTYGDGHVSQFKPENGIYHRPSGCFEELKKNLEGTYTLTFKDQLQFNYAADGRLSNITDKNGNITTLEYNGLLLTKVTEPGGRFLEYSYDTNNKLQQVRDSAGRAVSFTYDSAGNPITFTDVKGGVYTYTYDDNGITSIEDPLGHYIIRNTYDSQSRVVAQLDSKGQESTITYDLEARKNTVVDARGNETHYYYDQYYRVIKIQYADGTCDSYTYDSNHNRLTETNPNGQVTTYTYDDRGNMLTNTDPLGNTTTYQYDVKNNPILVTNAADHNITYTYDEKGNLLTTTIIVSGKTVTNTISYDDSGLPIELIDSLGNTTTLTYDECGNLLTTTDALGNTTSFTYDEMGRRLSKTNALGHTISYTYDPAGNVLTEEDSLGNTVNYTYDAVNNLTSMTDANGGITTYIYDENDKLVQIIDPLSNVTTITYDANNNKTAVTDAAGNITSYTYDQRDRLISVTDPEGYSESYTLDGNGNILSIIDKNGNITEYEYDDLNRHIQITDDIGGVIQYEYDVLGNKLSETNQLNNTVHYTYNEASQVLAITDPLSNTTTYTYDLAGNPLTMTDPRGETWSYEYDALNRLINTIDPVGGFTQTIYDELGNVIAKTDAKGNTTHYTYNENSRLISLTDALGNTTKYTYDSAGNRLTLQSSDNQIWSYEYDALNRPIKVTDPLGNVSLTSYDSLGNVIAQIDGNGNLTQYYYNGQRLLTALTDPLNNTTYYQYDGNGNLTTVTDAKGNIRTFQYNAQNLLIQETDNDRKITKEYDLAGNIISRRKADGTIINYSYDSNNRLTKVVYPDNSTGTYTYNELGARTSMTDPNGTTEYTYDRLGRLSSVTRDKQTVSYSYDATGNLSQLTYPDGSTVSYTTNEVNRMTAANDGINTLNLTYDNLNRRTAETLPNGVEVTYHYDQAGRLSLLDHQFNGTSLAKAAYTYDGNNNRLSMVNEQEQETRYSYDPLNQLIQVAYPSGKIVDYIYDPTGNRLETSGEGDVPILLPKGAASYEYDYEDRLSTFQDETNDVSYLYDGDGNLIKKIIVNETKTDTYEYFYDYSAGLPRLLVEKKNDTEIYNYLYAGRLYARKGVDGTVYYHQDGLGSTIAITDQNGNILNQYEYDVYGTPKAIKETVENNILFTGELYDNISRLYYLRARYYNPATGRFMTPDTYFGELDNPLSQNLYIYCQNNPVNFVDPSGHARCELDAVLDSIKEFFIEYGPEILDGTQFFLDVAGLVPVYGEPADCINAIIYTLRGDKTNAALSAVAIIPIAGWFSTGGKFFLKYGDEAIAVTKNATKAIKNATKEATEEVLTKKADDVISKGAGKAYRYVGESELNVIKKTGTIPNTDRAGSLKDVFVSPNKYNSITDAEKALQIGKQNPFGATGSPMYRVEFDMNAVKYRYGGNVEGGTGIELITEQSIPIDLSKIFKLK